MKIKYLSFVLVSFLIANDASADMKKSLKTTFDALNFNSNVSGPSAFTDQSGGYYTLGSVYARSAPKNVNLVNIQNPSFAGNCNGINAFLGALSFIKGDQIVGMLKGAIPAAAGYAFSIAMQTALPQVYNTLTEMQDWIQKANAANINSCHLGALAAGGLLPKSDASSATLCRAIKMGSAIPGVDDHHSAKHACEPDEARRSINKGKSGEFKDILGEEFNLVWKAIRKNSFLSGDQKTSEYFMSISGTLLKNAGDRYAKHKPSLAFDQNLIEMLLFGTDTKRKSNKKAKVYKCTDETDCLDMKKITYKLSKEGSIAYQVEEILTSLIDRLRNNEAPTEKEMGLVNSTAIPIMEMLIVETAYRRGKSPMSVLNYKDEIAYDILINELNSILDLVHMSLGELEKVQIDGATIHRFKQEIKDVRARLYEDRKGVLAHIDRAMAAIQQTDQLKRKLQYRFKQYANMGEG